MARSAVLGECAVPREEVEGRYVGRTMDRVRQRQLPGGGNLNMTDQGPQPGSAESRAAQARVEILARALDQVIEAHRFAHESFAALDAKVSTSLQIAALYLAGSVALFNSFSPETHPLAVAAAVLTYGLFVGALLVLLWTLRVREVTGPIDASAMDTMAGNLAKLPDTEDWDEVRVNWYRDQLRAWAPIPAEVERVNKDKARSLVAAHYLLATGVLSAGAATIAAL